MLNRDVEFLYRHIPLRTTVIITDRTLAEYGAGP